MDPSLPATASRKHNRVQLACTPCRQGKLKCNREVPTCDQCFKRSREGECRYTERGLRYNAARRRAEDVREKIERLEGFVGRMVREGEGDVLGGGGDGREGNGSVEAASEAKEEQDVVPLMGNLRVAGSGGTKYVGPSHWESIIEDIADVKAYFDLENDEPDPTTSSEDTSPFSNNSSGIPHADIVQGVSALFSKEELLSFLPPKQEVDRLVASWFTAAEPLKLILHAPTFQREYHTFWSDPASVLTSWLALLFSICGTGAEISGQQRQDHASLARAEDFRRLSSHTLILADYMSKPQPYVIEAIQIQVKGLLLKNHDSVPATWHLHGQALRMMLLAGYQRDPGLDTAISAFECEMRRRVWLFAYEYDVMTSYQLGTVSLLNRSMCDTKAPSNLRDSDFSPESVPQSRPSEEHTPILMEIYNIQLIEVYGEIVALSHSVTPSAKTDLKGLNDRLDAVRGSLPQVLKPQPMSDSLMDSAEVILDRFRLESLYLKALCVLYRPFVRDAEHSHHKACCLKASLELIECQVAILEAAQPGGQLASSAVFLSRHVHDFNFAAMLLCYELKRASGACVEDGGDERLERGRVCSTILQACAAYNVLGVASPKARHALRAMQRFVQQIFAGSLHEQTTETTADRAATGRNQWSIFTNAHPPTTDTQFDPTAFDTFNLGPDFPQALDVGQGQLMQDPFGTGYLATMMPQPVWPTFKDPMT